MVDDDYLIIPNLKRAQLRKVQPNCEYLYVYKHSQLSTIISLLLLYLASMNSLCIQSSALPDKIKNGNTIKLQNITDAVHI